AFDSGGSTRRKALGDCGAVDAAGDHRAVGDSRGAGVSAGRRFFAAAVWAGVFLVGVERHVVRAGAAAWRATGRVAVRFDVPVDALPAGDWRQADASIAGVRLGAGGDVCVRVRGPRGAADGGVPLSRGVHILV